MHNTVLRITLLLLSLVLAGMTLCGCIGTKSPGSGTVLKPAWVARHSHCLPYIDPDAGRVLLLDHDFEKSTVSLKLYDRAGKQLASDGLTTAFFSYGAVMQWQQGNWYLLVSGEEGDQVISYDSALAKRWEFRLAHKDQPKSETAVHEPGEFALYNDADTLGITADGRLAWIKRGCTQDCARAPNGDFYLSVKAGLLCLRPDGRQRWLCKLPDPYTWQYRFGDDGTVYAVNGHQVQFGVGGPVAAVDKTGKLLWRASGEIPEYVGLVLLDGMLLANVDRNFKGYDLKGAELWTRQVPPDGFASKVLRLGPTRGIGVVAFTDQDPSNPVWEALNLPQERALRSTVKISVYDTASGGWAEHLLSNRQKNAVSDAISPETMAAGAGLLVWCRDAEGVAAYDFGK